jgi:putative ABC transport system ATP-binding protein
MKTCMIKTNKICKSFVTDGEVNNVIKNLDLEIYEEDFTVIMGSSGSGKSTLMYLLSGMDKVTSGDVYLKERNITHCKEKELASIRRNHIGFVFQGINLIPDLTIRENIISPTYKSKVNKSLLIRKVDELLEQIGLKEHENKFPSQLSGGQMQRTAICRSLINEPELIFADEPTGALNSSAGENVLDTFTAIHENGQSIVMVTHDLKAAVRGNRVIFIKDGRIDGELELGNFQKEESGEREKTLFDFLKDRGW